ncbi:MAG: hypothetical protein IJY03_06295 [Prevotella sp.]|nr:hypothetical protein [Prevotella sp.]
MIFMCDIRFYDLAVHNHDVSTSAATLLVTVVAGTGYPDIISAWSHS